MKSGRKNTKYDYSVKCVLDGRCINEWAWDGNKEIMLDHMNIEEDSIIYHSRLAFQPLVSVHISRSRLRYLYEKRTRLTILQRKTDIEEEVELRGAELDNLCKIELVISRGKQIPIGVPTVLGNHTPAQVGVVAEKCLKRVYLSAFPHLHLTSQARSQLKCVGWDPQLCMCFQIVVV